jgi:hypothetical protein
VNPTVIQKLEALRTQLEAAYDKGAADEAHTVAGEQLAQAVADLKDQRADLDEEIALLEKAWSNWDYKWLTVKRYISPALAAKLKAERAYVYGEDAVTETTEEEWKEKILSALKAGYEKDGLDGLKMAAYKLEAGGASKKMLASVLSAASREHELDGLELKSDSKNGFALLVMYADDLKRGR